MNKLKVAVVMGGNSSEREVSLISGENVLKNIDKERFEVIKVVLPEDKEKLDGEIDVVFIAMHGKGGEDGEVQELLEEKGLKYTGCGVEASRVGMDKKKFRKLMIENGILMAKETNTVPCVVKPNNGGSSIGVSIVKKQEDLEEAIKEAQKYDQDVLVEEYIKGTEVTCGILGDEVLPIVEIVPKTEFFDYQQKYSETGAEEICPARLDEKTTKEVQRISKKVFDLIGGQGFSRVDLIVRDGVPYVLEINTIPGLTPNSLLPKEAKAAGYSYTEMLTMLIELVI